MIILWTENIPEKKKRNKTLAVLFQKMKFPFSHLFSFHAKNIAQSLFSRYALASCFFPLTWPATNFAEKDS
jgi:hypothetical protein